MLAIHDIAEARAPSGFHLINHGPNFNSHAGPFFYRATASSFVMGFRVLPHHLNPANVIHGGMSMVFADMSLALGMAVKCGIPIFTPTVNITADFLAGGPADAWVESDVTVIRRTRSMVFGETLLVADGVPFLRASAVIKIPGTNAATFDYDAVFPQLRAVGYVPEYGTAP